jgi:hypothetical protein
LSIKKWNPAKLFCEGPIQGCARHRKSGEWDLYRSSKLCSINVIDLRTGLHTPKCTPSAAALVYVFHLGDGPGWQSSGPVETDGSCPGVGGAKRRRPLFPVGFSLDFRKKAQTLRAGKVLRKGVGLPTICQLSSRDSTARQGDRTASWVKRPFFARHRGFCGGAWR